MNKTMIVASLCLLVGTAFFTTTAQGTVVWHDPWLNWDFINQTNQAVDDLDIWVDNPNWAVPPQNWWAAPFPNMTVTNNAGDRDGDGDQDTQIRYWDQTGGTTIPIGATAHGGLYMIGSGRVLDAYWTSNGAQVGPSTPVTYERTRIVGDPAVFMELNIAPGFFSDPDNTDREAGWTEIRTFVNIPAEFLGLADLNTSLDLDNTQFPDQTWLTDYEVTPRLGGPDGTIITPDTIILNPDDRVTDIFLADIPPEFSTPDYEALLVATVVATGSGPIPTGEFWNLNPQSPEPTTVFLLGLGTMAILRRRRT
jgi:hypothetical protein